MSFDVATGKCLEYHKLRDKQGDHKLIDSSVKKRILTSKLIIEYPEAVSDTNIGDNPSADVSKG